MPHTCDVGCLRWVECHLLYEERRQRHHGCWPGDVRFGVGPSLMADHHACGGIFGETTRCCHGTCFEGDCFFLVDLGSRLLDDVGERYPHLECFLIGLDLDMLSMEGEVSLGDEELPLGREPLVGVGTFHPGGGAKERLNP